MLDRPLRGGSGATIQVGSPNVGPALVQLRRYTVPPHRRIVGCAVDMYGVICTTTCPGFAVLCTCCVCVCVCLPFYTDARQEILRQLLANSPRQATSQMVKKFPRGNAGMTASAALRGHLGLLRNRLGLAHHVLAGSTERRDESCLLHGCLAGITPLHPSSTTRAQYSVRSTPPDRPPELPDCQTGS